MRPRLVQAHLTRLTRSQVARRLGVCVSTVRNLEGVELFPFIGERGVRYFDRERVEELADRIDGEDFLGLPPEKSRRAKALCLEMGTTLTAWVREQIETRLLSG